MRYWIAGGLALALSGCGGGTEGDVSFGTDTIGTTRPSTGTYVELADTTAATDTALSLIGHDNDGNAVVMLSAGALDHDANIFLAGSLPSGTVNPTRTRIELSDGSVLTLVALDGADHARHVSIEGASGPVFGILGHMTETADAPNGSDPTATYLGAARVTIADANGVYDLSGDARITADFSAGLVDVALSGLDGTLTQGPVIAVNDVGVIRLDDASLVTANRFEGGTPSASGAISLEPGASSAGSTGAFFGPGADEVGGTVLIDDTGAGGTTQILGRYLAD